MKWIERQRYIDSIIYCGRRGDTRARIWQPAKNQRQLPQIHHIYDTFGFPK